MILVFLGPPGCGKGTQAQMLVDNSGFIQISTGALLRQEVSAGSDLGRQIQKVITQGELVSDEIVTDLVRKHLIPGKRYILDGFPRTIAQANMLSTSLEASKLNVDAVISFEVADEIIVQRLSGRFSCKECGRIYNSYFSPPQTNGICDACGSKVFERRADDSAESVSTRLLAYHELTEPLVLYYSNVNLLHSVDANRDPCDVQADVKSVLSLLKNKHEG